jgi:hypothetical protein
MINPGEGFLVLERGAHVIQVCRFNHGLAVFFNQDVHRFSFLLQDGIFESRALFYHFDADV